MYMTNNQKPIEPEILDEAGRPISAAPKHEEPRRAVVGILSGIVALLSGIMAFIVFLVIAVIIAVPLFILSLFGKKPNVKIFKYKI